MIQNAKIVGENIDPNRYHIENHARGELDFVMSASQLKSFLENPKRWRLGYSSEDSEAKTWGSLIDCLALTPNRFNEAFAVCPERYTDAKTGARKPWTFQANVCKQWREDQAGKEIVKHELYQDAKTAIAEMDKDQQFKILIESSRKQVHVTAEFNDKETGLVIPLKMLIDLAPVKDSAFHKSLADLKTVRFANPRSFQRAVFDFGYHLSAALYLDGYNAATSDDREDFRFLLQESYAPWITGRRLLSAEFLLIGRQQYLRALRLYAMCLTTGDWPSHEELAEEEGRFVLDGFLAVEPDAYMVNP